MAARYDVDVPHICGADGGPSTEAAYMAHSNFRTSKVNSSPPRTRVEDEGGNQDAEPLFAPPPSLDFHQLAGSPTIDAGVVTPLLGSADIDGEPRTQGSAPDIGADEFVPPVVEPPVDMHRPVASLLAVTPGRFRVAAARSAARPARGADLLRAGREGHGHVHGQADRQAPLPGRKRTAYRPVRGSFTDAGEVGGNKLRFSGRLARPEAEAGPLSPGRAAGGRRGQHRERGVLRFRIVRVRAAQRTIRRLTGSSSESAAEAAAR